MLRKDFAGESVLLTDRLGEEKRVKEILTDWGMSPSAVARLLKEHRERQACAHRAHEEATEGAMPAPLLGVDPARPATHLS